MSLSDRAVLLPGRLSKYSRSRNRENERFECVSDPQKLCCPLTVQAVVKRLAPSVGLILQHALFAKGISVRRLLTRMRHRVPKLLSLLLARFPQRLLRFLKPLGWSDQERAFPKGVLYVLWVSTLMRRLQAEICLLQRLWAKEFSL